MLLLAEAKPVESHVIYVAIAVEASLPLLLILHVIMHGVTFRGGCVSVNLI